MNLRLRASATAGPPIKPARVAKASGKPVASAKANVIVGGARRKLPVYARDDLGAGARIKGPAIIVELSATAYVSPGIHLALR